MKLTDLIAALALALSLLALFWQWWTWRRSGPLIRVSGGIESPIDPRGFQSDVVYAFVRAVNIGRGAGPISAWGFLTEDGRPVVEKFKQEALPPVDERAFRLPLDPHSETVLYCKLEELRGHSGRLRPFVVSPTKGRIVGPACDV